MTDDQLDSIFVLISEYLDLVKMITGIYFENVFGITSKVFDIVTIELLLH